MAPDPTDRATRRPGIEALRASPCGMAHERISSGPDGLPLRDAASGGYARPDLCPAAVRDGNLGCSHTTARLALMRAADELEGDGAGALRGELRALDAALGALDYRRNEAEDRRADALRAGDGAAAALAEGEIRAIVADHRAKGLRVGEIRDLLVPRLKRLASGAGEPEPGGEAPATPAALAGRRSPLYAER